MVRPGKSTKRNGKRAKAMVRGHAITKLSQVSKSPSGDKGRLGKRVSLIRKVIRDVSGFAPYEKRVMDLI
jgi:large subunit ribosomal protein L36e